MPYQLTCRDDRHGGNPGLPTKVDEIVAVLKNLSKELPFIGVAKLIEELDNTAQKIEWLKDNADRYTPVNLGLLVNAQSLIDMAKLRLCNCAHHETIIVFQALKMLLERWTLIWRHIWCASAYIAMGCAVNSVVVGLITALLSKTN